MEEIVYSENGGMMRNMIVKSYTQTIGSDRTWKEDEGFQMYPYSDDIVGGQEELSVMMFRGTPNWTYMYDLQLEKGVTLGFIFKYSSTNFSYLLKFWLFDSFETTETLEIN